MRQLSLSLCLLASVAHAHFRFTPQPDGGSLDRLVVNAYGDPQKEPLTNGCPTGTPSNVVTTLVAGQTFAVPITETIMHPGHYRVALAQDPGTIPAPIATAGPNCPGRTVPAIAPPVLADGELQHSTTFPGPQTIDITVPNQPCSGCTLQVVEFMSAHAPPCFYYHCAMVNIVPAGTGGGAGGGSGGSGGGTAGGSGGSGGGTAGGAAGGVGDAPDGGTGGSSQTGCGCNGGGTGALGMLLVLAGLARRLISAASRT